MGSMEIKMKSSGHFRKLEQHLLKLRQKKFEALLESYGPVGVAALSAATPERTGKTASSWSYKITSSNGKIGISWTNSNVNDGVPIAILIQYGHGTGTGGYVPPVDYVNPAMKPIFIDIERHIREEAAKI